MYFLKNLSKGLLFSLSTAFLWACYIVNARFILRAGENPLNLTIWVGLMTITPWLFLFEKHTSAFLHLTKKHIVLLVVIGIADSVGVSYLESLALANTPAANFAFLYRTIVIFTIVFAWIFFKEKITRPKLFLAFAILLGSFLLTTNGHAIALTLGDIYTLLMAASAAFVSNILIKHTITRMHPDLSGSAISIVGTVALVIAGVVTGVFTLPHQFGLIFLGGVFSFCLVLTRNRAYKHATASFVTMVISTTPLFVSLLSYPLLHESLSFIEIIGGIIIVGSTIFVERLQL